MNSTTLSPSKSKTVLNELQLDGKLMLTEPLPREMVKTSTINDHSAKGALVAVAIYVLSVLLAIGALVGILTAQ